MKQLFDDLVGDPELNNVIGVTSITGTATTNRFEVHWSRSSNTTALPAFTTATLQRETARIPSMAPGDYALIVEVRSPYTPAFDIGLKPQVFTEFIVTRPRFLHCLPMDNVPCPVT